MGVAVYDPSLPLGHRRALYIKDGAPRIPARFAIDWIKLDRTGKTSLGGSAVLSSFYGFGEEVLAVADSVVASVRDSYPDELAESLAAKEKRRPEDVAGNYIGLDLGAGR